jgi:hypothetical protein
MTTLVAFLLLLFCHVLSAIPVSSNKEGASQSTADTQPLHSLRPHQPFPIATSRVSPGSKTPTTYHTSSSQAPLSRLAVLQASMKQKDKRAHWRFRYDLGPDGVRNVKKYFDLHYKNRSVRAKYEQRRRWVDRLPPGEAERISQISDWTEESKREYDVKNSKEKEVKLQQLRDFLEINPGNSPEHVSSGDLQGGQESRIAGQPSSSSGVGSSIHQSARDDTDFLKLRHIEEGLKGQLKKPIPRTKYQSWADGFKEDEKKTLKDYAHAATKDQLGDKGERTHRTLKKKFLDKLTREEKVAIARPTKNQNQNQNQ